MNVPEDMITEAVNIAFSMVTLVPPAFISLPEHYNEDWVEPRTTCWNTKSSSKTEITIYFRPTLFYGSSCAGVGSRAEVGNDLIIKGQMMQYIVIYTIVPDCMHELIIPFLKIYRRSQRRKYFQVLLYISIIYTDMLS